MKMFSFFCFSFVGLSVFYPCVNGWYSDWQLLKLNMELEVLIVLEKPYWMTIKAAI
jgi:hypothetical protein